MARLEQVQVNGVSIPIGSGLEGRIASAIGRNGAASCVILQVGIDQKSFSFAFPSGCGGGGGGGGGGGSWTAELDRLNKVYVSGLEKLERTAPSIRSVVIGFLHEL